MAHHISQLKSELQNIPEAAPLGAVTELQEPNSPEPSRPTRRRSTETGQQQSASVSWSQTTEIVEVLFKTERQKTPPVEILFRNMTSSAIVSETRNSL
jgi:hypothetical protein